MLQYSESMAQQNQDSQDKSKQTQHSADDEECELDVADENNPEEASQKDTQPHSSTYQSHIKTVETPSCTRTNKFLTGTLLAATSTSGNSTERTVTTATNNLLKGKSKRRKIIDVSNTPGFDKALSKFEHISKNAKSEDEFETFDKHIANQLRQLPLHKALQMQQTFQNILTEERMC